MPNILKRTSFGLIRTNPRLTTNIKLVADSKNKIYLESIDADPLLSKSIYKGFELSYNGSYAFDVNRFYTQNGNSLPTDIAYKVFEEDLSLDIKNRYNNQYDFTYGAGFQPKNSKIYTEEYSIFAPIWLETENIPDYFVIFKIDGPVTINPKDPLPGYPAGYTGPLDDSAFLNNLIEDPANFFENYVQKARIIKTFDLSYQTALGTYIRNYVNNEKFPESSLYMSLENGAQSYWNGISYDKGGFCSIANDVYKDYVLVDKTITESDDFITTGFKRNKVVCANILNLEFLFDDEEQEEYKFSRYFGIYASTAELGKFIIDNNRLYDDSNTEITQIPRPIIPNIGDPLNVKESQIQYNSNGIKVYPHIGASGPFSGRLLTFNEIQNPRFSYIKDTKGNFYSIDNYRNWDSVTYVPDPVSGTQPVIDSNYLRIKNQKVDWKNFSGFDTPFAYIESFKTTKRGRPGVAFRVTGIPSSGDEIRMQYIDWNNPKDAKYIDRYTISADSGLSAGTASFLSFSSNGTLKQIASAIAKSINNIKDFQSDVDGNYTIFSAIAKEDTVIVFSRVDSETWNKMKMSIFSKASVFPFDISDQYENPISVSNYQPSPIATSPLGIGRYVETNFFGGNNNPSARAIVNQDDVLEFRDTSELIYVKTEKGYDTTNGYGLYLDEPVYSDNGEIIDFKNFDKFYVVNLKNTSNNISFGSSNKLALYKLSKNSCGYLSIYPIKDFDFRFKSEEYNRDADSNINRLYSWYKGETGPNGAIPVFGWTAIGSTGQNLITEILGPSSSFVSNGGYQKLIGYVDPNTDDMDLIINEYDRLKEFDISELALSSRVVPYINKWVYDNESVNVREVPYRLNTNGAFGFSNFSPSFETVQRSNKFFTHEWYYLQKYPPYMNFDEKVNSFSYFDNEIYFPNIPDPGATGANTTYAALTGATGASANLISINEDYFISYFTRETVDGFPIKRDFKYSIFGGGDRNKAAETLFRGAKVEIKDRFEFSEINYNKESLRYIYNEKYNGYKFSAVLTFGNAGSQLTFIKNDKFKSVTLVIEADLNDVQTKYTIGPTGPVERFIDRSLLYTINDQLGYTATPTPSLTYTNRNVSGLIYDWVDTGSSFIVLGKKDDFGNFPQFSNDLTLNENGSYNDLVITSGSLTYTFQGISNPQGNSFECGAILGLPLLPQPLTPNGNWSYIDVQNFWTLPGTFIYEAPFKNNPTYVNEGYNGYSQLIDQISFSTISTLINTGDPEIRYISVDSNGNVEFNTYSIDISKPDYPLSSTYLKRQAIQKSAYDLQLNAPILGYEIAALDRVAINNISRYRGSYNPKFLDIIQFVDTNDLKSESLDYKNIQILTKIPTALSSKGYYGDDNLGKIIELYSNKVNVENPNIILSNSKNRFSASNNILVYPLVGEVAIDSDNFFTFKSNWDINYYKKYNKATQSIYIIGTREPKEEKSFFGSKAIAIPNGVRIETFPNGVLSEDDFLEFGSINNTTVNLVQRFARTQTSNQLTIDVYVTKALEDWLIQDGFGEEFYKYIDPNYSFGDYGLNDDVKIYIRENIFNRYAIKEIIFWEKTYKPTRGVIAPDQIVTNLTDEQKLAAGYVVSKNFRTITNNTGGLDFSLIYTIPNDRRTSITFTVVLEKK